MTKKLQVGYEAVIEDLEHPEFNQRMQERIEYMDLMLDDAKRTLEEIGAKRPNWVVGSKPKPKKKKDNK